MKYEILVGNAINELRSLPDESVSCVVTSPPYWGLRDYGSDNQIGQEPNYCDYIDRIIDIFREVKRVLRHDGTMWINIGDSYAAGAKHRAREQATANSTLSGKLDPRALILKQINKVQGTLKPKDLIGIPWRIAFALQEDGWWLRQDIIWAKPNGMPGSQTDRCTSSHEYIFMLTKSRTYWSDFDAIKTPPRESSLERLAQDIQSQAGSHRANGGEKSNGSMKAVRASDKQRGHSRRHAGFNDRWDHMSAAEQQSRPSMMRDVWFIPPAQFAQAHFAVMPEEIARRCILAGCPEGGVVLDPFSGAGTTGVVALRCGRSYIGIELNIEYVVISKNRIEGEVTDIDKRNYAEQISMFEEVV